MPSHHFSYRIGMTFVIIDANQNAARFPKVSIIWLSSSQTVVGDGHFLGNLGRCHHLKALRRGNGEAKRQ